MTIAQTNVMTAAEAAAASSAAAGGAGSTSGSAAGGGAGRGGGGLSTTTLAIVGGAIAGGAIVAKETVLGGGGGVSFKGDFSGVLPDTISSVGPGPAPCTQNERQTGTMTIDLDGGGDTVSGSMNVRGDIALTPGTCPPGAYNNGGHDTFGLDEGAAVSGSRDNIKSAGHHQNDYRNADGGGVNAYDFTFTGRSDGDQQISGSLTVARDVTWRTSDGGYASTSHGAVTYQVTLGKQ